MNAPFGSAVCAVLAVFWAPAAATARGSITEFRVPSATGDLAGITAGPDGNLWFTDYEANNIGRITTAGAITEFPIPTESSGAKAITAGPDGNLWFTQAWANQIGRITPDGTITDYLIPSYYSGPAGITAGPDGNLWFTENSIDANRIGRITPAGEISEFPLPATDSFPDGITSGPDGNVWFTERRTVGRIIPGGDPRPVKKVCPVYSDPHTPVPTKTGNRTLTDEITTSTYACLLRKPVVLCRPLAAHTAGERAFCTSTVSKRGKVRVKSGREPVRVTVIARAKPKPDFADRWKPSTWRESWILLPARN